MYLFDDSRWHSRGYFIYGYYLFISVFFYLASRNVKPQQSTVLWKHLSPRLYSIPMEHFSTHSLIGCLLIAVYLLVPLRGFKAQYKWRFRSFNPRLRVSTASQPPAHYKYCITFTWRGPVEYPCNWEDLLGCCQRNFLNILTSGRLILHSIFKHIRKEFRRKREFYTLNNTFSQWIVMKSNWIRTDFFESSWIVTFHK